MKRAIILALILCALPVHAGSYTITTDATTDTSLQNWCFAKNAALNGTLFAQPGSASGITVANVKVCMKTLIAADAASLGLVPYQQAYTPPAFSQWN